MKVPVIDSPSVGVRQAPIITQNREQDQGSRRIAEGVANIAGSIASTAIDAASESARKADEMVAEQAATQYQMDALKALHGAPDAVNQDFGLDLRSTSKDVAPSAFLSTKGLDASRKSADVADWLTKRQSEIEKALPSDRQRELFRNKARGIYQNSYKTIELHAAKQFAEAEEATLKARVVTSMAAIESGYTDADTVKSNSDVIFEIARKKALSPEDAAARVKTADEEINALRLRQYLKSGDYAGAEELYNNLRGRLGPKEDAYGKTIGEMKLSREGEFLARDAVEQSRDPEGRVDADAARRRLDRLGAGPLTDEARKRAEDRLADEEKAWKSKVSAVHSKALTAFYDAGESISAIDPQDRAWLIRNAPEKWGDITDLHAKKIAQGRAEISFRESRVKRVQGARNEEQVQAFEALQADIADNQAKYRNMSAEQFHSDWRPQLGEKLYQSAYKAFTSVQKDNAASIDEFNRYVTGAINRSPLLTRKDEQNKFKGLMHEARRLKIESTGKPLTMSDFRELEDTVWKREKNWFGSTKTVLREPEELAPTSAPTRPQVGGTPVGNVSKTDRIRQLLRAGKSDKEIAATLKAEGF